MKLETPHPSPIKATVELVFASIIWGFGFIASVWALRDLGAFTLSSVRFGLAALFFLPIIYVFRQLRVDLSLKQARLACLPGLFLAATLLLQTWGQKHTTATKSGFITTLYILFVPILERWALKTRLHRFHFVFVGLGLIGTALICQLETGSWNFGDALTLLCALAASVHILWFGLIKDQIGSPITFNFWQSLWGFFFSLPWALGFENSQWLPTQSLAWIGLGCLTFGSTMLAFFVQIRAQKVLSPSVASFVYLLESPFATLFAFTLLGERLGASQWLGALLILGAVGFSTYLATQKRSETPEGQL